MHPIIIQNVQPLIDGGRYPLKREVGDSLRVRAEIFRHGHDIVLAHVKYRKQGAP